VGILLSFLPWIVFLALPGEIGVRWSAALATLLTLAVVFKDVRRGRFKLLDLKAAVFFAGFFGASFLIAEPTLTRWAPSIGSAAILLIVLTTILIGQPFTTPYAKEMTPAEVWDSPRFKRANRDISLGWLASFGLMLAAALLLALAGLDNPALQWAAQIGGIAGPILFQNWYRRRL
jgi:hypothetical protein